MGDDAPNAFAQRLGIAVPRLEEVARRPGLSYLELFVAALLEHGGPMTLDEVLYAVHRALPAEHPEFLRVSLMKSWGGRPPIVKEHDGRYGLDLGAHRLPLYLRRLGLRTPPPLPEVTALAERPGPEVPLTREELPILFRHGPSTFWTPPRIAAAVLDAYDRPMTPEEILEAVGPSPREPWPRPAESRATATPGLVLRDEAGRLSINRASEALRPFRATMRAQMLPYFRSAALHARDSQAYAERRRIVDAEIAQRLALAKRPKPGKQAWRGVVVAVQPRIRLTRSYDQRSHAYLGYVFRVLGELDGEEREFLVAIGEGAQEKHAFRVGDEVAGVGEWVAHPDLEVADLYKASAFEFGARGPAPRTSPPPVTGVPPTLPEYRARGHRRLAAVTYASKCTTCLFGAEMAVEIVIDQWNPTRRKYRRETFCYGPKSCPRYAAGPRRQVPGRKGMSFTEADWIDEEATRHRGEDD